MNTYMYRASIGIIAQVVEGIWTMNQIFFQTIVWIQEQLLATYSETQKPITLVNITISLNSLQMGEYTQKPRTLVNISSYWFILYHSRSSVKSGESTAWKEYKR